MEKLNVKITGPGMMPMYAREGDAGCDLFYHGEKNLLLPPGKITKVPTGIFMEIPEGYEGQIRPRSGLSLKGIVGILGTIDSGYRGEISVIVHNVSQDPYIIEPNFKIGQMVFNKYRHVSFERVHVLSDSERGAGGFGSTDRTLI